MKKGLLFLFALLGLGASGVWAQTVTDRVSAGDPMTFSEFKALSGTGKHFAIVGSSSNTQFCYQNWFGFSANFVETLTTDHLFDLESSATGEGWYNIKRVSDDKYVSTEGGNFDAITKMDFKLVNRRAGDYASEFSNSDLHVSLDNAAGNHYNCNTANLGFRSGTGGYSTYITYGPFYVVTVKCLDENDNVIQTIPCIVKEGTTTIEAPNIDGKSVLDATSKAISGDRDEEITFSYVNGVIVTYSKDTGSYTTTGNFVHEWNSTATDPQVTFAVSGGANNIASSTGYIYSGANGCTYVLTAQNGYLITGYEIVGTAQTAAQTLTPAAGGSATEFSTEGTTTLRVTGLSVQSTSFTQSTPNNGIAISSFKIFLEEVTTTATYVISHGNGVVYTSAPLPATPGENVTTLPSDLQRAYCEYSVTPTQIIAGENTVNVTVTFNNMPFEVSADYATAKWYFMTLRGKYLSYGESTPYKGTDSKDATNEAYQWAFIGTPYGINIINKAAGNGKYLSYDNAANNISPYMKDSEKGWVLDKNNSGFVFRLPEDKSIYMHLRTPNLSTCSVSEWSAVHNDAGSTFTVEEVPDAVVDVTYDLYVGGEKVKTVVAEGVAANSQVAIPESLTSGYNSMAYDFATSGTIGTENCTITVTGTLKEGVVTDLSQLSNAKAYKFNTARGLLGTNGTQMVSTFGTSFSASNFAVISYEEKYYLYSVSDEKFVGNPTTINGVGSQPVLTDDLGNVSALVFDGSNATTASPLFFMGYGSNGVNVSNYATGIVVNNWTTRDAGNQYCIIEAADFDATEALAVLEEYFHPAAEAQFAQAIEALEAINFGTGLNQYGFTGQYAGYTSQAETVISGLKQQGYSDGNLQIAQALLSNYAINVPSAGFYRIKGNTSGKYLAAGMASNGKFAMSDATNASTIFYYDGTKLTNLGSGMCNGVTSTAWAWVTEDIASNVTFVDGETNGGYSVQTADVFFFDGGTSADRGQGRDDRAQYRSWYLEAVTTLPVTISTAKYATLYAPVALTIPDGVTAYYVSALSKTEATLTEISNTIPANTGVILYADVTEETTFGFKIADEADAINGNQLAGKVAAWNVQDGEAYTLRRSAEDESQVGLFMKEAGTLVGFKAYMPATPEAVQMGGSVKGFVFNFDNLTTGIVKMADGTLKLEGAPVYDLSGRKVAAPTKGIYVVKGKKVAIK